MCLAGGSEEEKTTCQLLAANLVGVPNKGNAGPVGKQAYLPGQVVFLSGKVPGLKSCRYCLQWVGHGTAASSVSFGSDWLMATSVQAQSHGIQTEVVRRLTAIRLPGQPFLGRAAGRPGTWRGGFKEIGDVGLMPCRTPRAR